MPDVLEVGAVVDVTQFEAGFGAMAKTVEATTSGMVADFKVLADTSVAADEAMIAGMAKLTGSIQVLTESIAKIPVRAVPAVKETENAFVRLQERLISTAETAKLSATGISGAFSGLGKLFGAGIAAGFFLHFIDETQEAVLHMAHLADRTGFAIETIAGLKYAADATGVSMEALGMGLTRLLRAQELAAQGGKKQEQAFYDIGLSVESVKSLSPEDLFYKVGEAMSQATSAADANAAAFTLLGRGGGQLIPLFREYGDQLKVVVDEHGKLSLVTKEAAERALEYKRVIADLSETIRAIMIPVMEGAVIVIKGWQDAWIILKATVMDVVLSIESGVNNAVTSLSAMVSASASAVSGQFGEVRKILDAAGAEIEANSKATSKQVEDTWTAAYARLQAIMAKPLIFGKTELSEPPSAEKLGDDSEKKALLEATLKVQLATIDVWRSAQKLAYAEGKIDAQAWAAAETEADSQAYWAHEEYFSKLKALYASDPKKLAVAGQEQLDFELSSTAKATNELATETEKLNKELLRMGEEATKTHLKDFDNDLKATDKAALDLSRSLAQLGQAQLQLNQTKINIDFTNQEAAIKERIRVGLVSEAQGEVELKGIYAQERDDQLNHLNSMVETAKESAAVLERLLAGDPTNAEAKARYNGALADLNNYETQRLEIEQRYNLRSQQLDDQRMNHIMATYHQITASINSSVAGWLTGQMTFAKAVQQVWTQLAADIINHILQIGERWIAEHIIMAAAAKLFGGPTDNTAERASQARSIIRDDAAQAGADVFAQAIASIPFPTNLAVAPPLAAATDAQVMAFTAQVGGNFLGGGIAPHDMPAFLHANEMVLPAELSTGVQEIIKEGGSSTNQDGDTYNLHTHIHQGDVSTLDSSGMDQVLRRNRSALSREVHSAVRSGYINLRNLGY